LIIDWLIACRYAEVHDNLGTIVGAGIDTFWLPEVPAPIQVGLVVRLLAQADELGEDHKHRTRNIITDPSGDVVSDLGGEFAVGMANAREDWLNGIMLVTAIRFEATHEGTYQFEQIVDDSNKTLALHVVHGTPSGA